MNTMEAIPVAYKLWRKWVSNRPAVGIDGYIRHSSEPEEYKAYDLAYIQQCILQEIKFHHSGKSTASPTLMREVRGEAILLGKIRKLLNE